METSLEISNEIFITFAKKFKKDKTIVMNNAKFHRKKKLLEIDKKHNMNLIFLQPYSPELNPIKKFLDRLKSIIRANPHKFYSLNKFICSIFQVVIMLIQITYFLGQKAYYN